MKRKPRHIKGLSKPRDVLARKDSGLPPTYSRVQLENMAMRVIEVLHTKYLLPKKYWKKEDFRKTAMINHILRVQNLAFYNRKQLYYLPDSELIYICKTRGANNYPENWTREQQIDWIIGIQKLLREDHDEA